MKAQHYDCKVDEDIPNKVDILDLKGVCTKQ
jgi:hypothetical protein